MADYCTKFSCLLPVGGTASVKAALAIYEALSAEKSSTDGGGLTGPASRVRGDATRQLTARRSPHRFIPRLSPPGIMGCRVAAHVWRPTMATITLTAVPARFEQHPTRCYTTKVTELLSTCLGAATARQRASMRFARS